MGRSLVQADRPAQAAELGRVGPRRAFDWPIAQRREQAPAWPVVVAAEDGEG